MSTDKLWMLLIQPTRRHKKLPCPCMCVIFCSNSTNQIWLCTKKERNKIINLLRVMHLLHHRSRKNTSKTNQIFSSSNLSYWLIKSVNMLASIILEQQISWNQKIITSLLLLLCYLLLGQETKMEEVNIEHFLFTCR